MSERTDLAGSRIVLKHAYRIGEAAHRSAIAVTYSGVWEVFDEPVYVRYYEPMARLRLRSSDAHRLRSDATQRGILVRGRHLPDTIDRGQESKVRPFVVMRLPPGEMLDERLQREGALPPEDAARVVLAVASALETCREAGMNHRGPTPDRVWLGDEGEVVLLGLGEVLYRDETLAMSGVAGSELLWHLPPEVFAADASDEAMLTRPISETGPIPARGDTRLEESLAAEVYALACLAHQCLTGRHPFFLRPEDPSQGIRATLQFAPPDFELLAPWPDAREVVAEGLARDPADRPQTPSGLARAYAVALGAAPSVAAPDTSASAEIGGDKEASSPERAPQTPSGELSPDGSRDTQLWFWRTLALLLACVVVGYIGYLRFRTVSVVITSEPSGVELVERVGHTTERRGETPIILYDRSPLTPIQLQVIGPDDSLGRPSTHQLGDAQDLGWCRRIALEVVEPDSSE